VAVRLIIRLEWEVDIVHRYVCVRVHTRDKYRRADLTVLAIDVRFKKDTHVLAYHILGCGQGDVEDALKRLIDQSG